MSVNDWLVLVYAFGAVVLLVCGTFGLIDGYDPARRDSAIGKADRKEGARLALAAPVWPIVLVVWAPFGVIHLFRLAFGKEAAS